MHGCRMARERHDSCPSSVQTSAGLLTGPKLARRCWSFVIFYRRGIALLDSGAMITLRHAKDDGTAWKRRRIGVPSLSALSGHQVSRLLGLRVGFRIRGCPSARRRYPIFVSGSSR